MKYSLTGLATWFAAMIVATAADFYVAPAGTDANPGTVDKPFATIDRARQAARTLAGKEPITVTVRAGIYYLSNTLAFGQADSGSEQARIVYQAAPGETAVLSGGSRLELKWKPSKDGIFKAQTPADLQIDQLFVNGQCQHMARYPDFDPAQPVFNGYASNAFSPERAARWSDPRGGFIHAMHKSLWGGFAYVITGKDAQGNVTYEGGWQNNRRAAMHKDYRFVENIFEELDAPGEWFYDAKSGTLYFYPPSGVDLSHAIIEVVRLRDLVEFNGSATAPVRFISLRGFTFRHAARTFMETKEPLLRSDWTICRGGAVLMTGTEDCAVVDCTFDQLGGNTIFVNNYNRRVTIRGCLIKDSGGNGVAFVGDPAAVRNPLFEYGRHQGYATIDKTPGPKTDNYPSDCIVDDCLITRIGRVEKQAAGVEISMSRAITVRHCSIYEVPRAGINIGDGCWGGHVIEGCDVFDTVLETGDHGSFNAWGRDRYWRLEGAPGDELPSLALLDAVDPIIIRNSRWRCDHGWDIDLDDGSSHYEICSNLMLNGGLKLREGFARKAWNNITVNNSLCPHVWFSNCADVVTHNIFMGALKPAAMDKNLQKWGQEVDDNFYTTGDADRSKFADKGCDLHSASGDPQFLDPAHGDFRVAEGSEALKTGFRNFPMDQFGVQKPGLKAIARTPVIPVINSTTDRPTETEKAVSWAGASFRNLAGEEYSVVGVAKDAGGALVVEVPAGCPAEKAGLRSGDFLQAINGKPLKGADTLMDVVRGFPPDQPLKLAIVRNQKTEALEMKP